MPDARPCSRSASPLSRRWLPAPVVEEAAAIERGSALETRPAATYSKASARTAGAFFICLLPIRGGQAMLACASGRYLSLHNHRIGKGVDHASTHRARWPRGMRRAASTLSLMSRSRRDTLTYRLARRENASFQGRLQFHDGLRASLPSDQLWCGLHSVIALRVAGPPTCLE